MIRIGDFSRLSRVSIKTLRYYDELGLIKPVRVDNFTGYRYYDHAQYSRLSRVLALKDLGFTLEQIGGLLDSGLTGAQMRGMLELRRGEIQQRITEDQGRLDRIDAWLSRLTKEDSMTDPEVVIKRVDLIRVASVRGVVPTPSQQGLLWCKLESHLAERNVSPVAPCIALYHDDTPKEQDWDIEVCAPIAGELAATNEILVRTLPPVETMATVVHRGPWLTVSEAYGSLGDWAKANGYHVVGPCREVVLHTVAEEDASRRESGIGANQADSATVVEVQFPVAKT